MKILQSIPKLVFVTQRKRAMGAGVFVLQLVFILLLSTSGIAQIVYCPYIPGDVNGNGTVNALDVVAAVVYFKGGTPPAVDCGNPVGPCNEASPFYAAGDVNNTCSFNGIDITYFVRYFKLQVPNLIPCWDCLPI
jgi:hypothetical protein